MTKLVRTKEGPHPWVTEVETGGGGGGGDLEATLAAGNDGGGQQIKNIADGTDDQDAATVIQLTQILAPPLSDVLGEGNDAGDFQIKGLADGSDPTDAVTLQQLEAGAPTLDAVLANGNDADERDITNVGALGGHTADFDGGDGSQPGLHVTGPGASPIAFIGDEGDSFGITVNVGSVAINGDPNDADATVSMGVGVGQIFADNDGLHLGDASGQALVGMFGQDPIPQGTAIADAADPGEAVTQLNLLLAFLRERGDIALS